MGATLKLRAEVSNAGMASALLVPCVYSRPQRQGGSDGAASDITGSSVPLVPTSLRSRRS
jgi:hypothetical protein